MNPTFDCLVVRRLLLVELTEDGFDFVCYSLSLLNQIETIQCMTKEFKILAIFWHFIVEILCYGLVTLSTADYYFAWSAVCIFANLLVRMVGVEKRTQIFSASTISGCYCRTIFSALTLIYVVAMKVFGAFLFIYKLLFQQLDFSE